MLYSVSYFYILILHVVLILGSKTELKKVYLSNNKKQVTLTFLLLGLEYNHVETLLYNSVISLSCLLVHPEKQEILNTIKFCWCYIGNCSSPGTVMRSIWACFFSLCKQSTNGSWASVIRFLSSTGCHTRGKKSVPCTTAILISGTSILSELGDANRQVNGQESLTLNELKHI